MLESGIDQGKVVDADLVRAEIRRSGEMIHEELSARSRDLTALIFRLGGKIYGSDKTLSKRYGKSISGLRSKLRELEVLGMVSVSLDNRGRLSYLLSPELMAFYSAKQEAQKPPRRELKEFLSPEMKILMELYRSGPLTYQEISSRLDMGKALTSRRLTVLMDQGLIDGEWHTMNPGSARRMFMRRYGLRGELSSLKNPPRFPPFQRTNPRRPRRSKRGR
jgi:DNA-binding transcriptional ArsR family regulator